MQRYEFSSLYQSEFDIVVIGGGITGAAVAYQAAAQGLKVVLLEMRDFGSATSAATSKLIHGGLRYLKNWELGLVRQSLRERRILGNIASNLVEPLRFVIPFLGNKTSSSFALKAGMRLYDLLSFDKQRVSDSRNRLPPHKNCTSSEIIELAPFLNARSLKGGISYYDYANVNPDRMTLAFLRSGYERGAVLANYAKVTDLLKEGQRVVGVKVLDQLTQKSTTLRASWVINCTGAWVDENFQEQGQGRERVRSEGVHLITKKLSCKCATVIQTASGQHLMFLPWRGLTIVGPTDRPYRGSPSNYRPTHDSIEELIDSINTNISAENMGGPFSRSDILFHYGGLRPLVDSGSSAETYSASRRHEIIDHQVRDGLTGLISVEGGKYTTSRGLAEQVIRLIGKRTQWNVRCVDTSQLTLANCLESSYDETLEILFQKYGKHYQPSTISYYAKNYGSLAAAVLDTGLRLPDGQQLITSDGEIMAEIDYVLNEEMVYSLSDLLLRRTGVAWVGQPPDHLMQKFAAKLGSKLGWSPEQQSQAIQRFIEDSYTLP